MAQIIDGKAVSRQVRERVANETAKLKEKGVTPGLAVIIVGEDPASQVYVRNKEKALEVLKGKLLLLEEEKQNEKLSGIKGEQLSNGWGSAKRSYVMQPYTLIKDNISGYESSNVNAILDGEIEEMLEYGIKE